MKTPQGPQQVKFTITKSCLARFSGIFAVGTPSNIHGTAISYRCAKFGAFVNSVTILTLRDLTIARKCESKHWLPCGADGRSGVRSRDYQIFSDG